jgi:uncharacterized protein (UPF0248 family)
MTKTKSDSYKQILKELVGSLAYHGKYTYGQYSTVYRDRVEALLKEEKERERQTTEVKLPSKIKKDLK